MRKGSVKKTDEMGQTIGVGRGAAYPGAGLAGWLLGRLRLVLNPSPRSEPRLALLERISLAPRQSLALVEAEGRRLLVATSPDGGPAFYALDGLDGNDAVAKGSGRRKTSRRVEKVSW